ncbi:Gfo/Idh/MocA family oxidoreductase [Pseudomonas sp. LB3P81]
MYNFLLVGAGQLGSRHLQALAQCDFGEVTVYVVDPSQESLDIAKVRFDQIQISSQIKNIHFLTNISHVNEVIDFCVISTGANCRLQVIEQLFSHVKVNNLLLEKVLFQSVEQLNAAESLLETYETQVWVNCPRRMFPIYSILKEKLLNESAVNLTVVGNDWGLACNSIHFIDIWAYLSNCTHYQLNLDSLASEIIESKRPGYKEVTGTISGASNKGGFALTSIAKDTPSAIDIKIETDNFLINVDESKGLCVIEYRGSGVKEEIPFTNLYQSQLTQVVAKSVILDKRSSLTAFAESAALHRPLLSGLLDFFNDKSDTEYTFCPIT